MTAKILMCPPDFYGIKYEINPWMHVEIKSEQTLAIAQWNNLYKILKEDIKADVKLVKPETDVPDMVFSANAALIYKNKAIISRFKYEQRQPEEKYFAKWFEENGFEVIWLPDGIFFEGAGDALFLGDVLYSGYVPRTDISSHNFIAELLGVQVLSLELVNPRFYHLDTCFCPLEDGYLIYYPDAFDTYANKVIESNVPEEKRIVVNEEEAKNFTCNAVNVGKNVITNLTTKRFEKLLNDKGFTLYQTDLSEYMKAGGSSKCLTLKLN
jgi:N-dimethylarginine dimethylaminohydrolase